MFDRHFEVLLADTDWAKDIHYKLRYQVYCLDRGYEDPQTYPDQRERDCYDDSSAHFLIRSTESKEWLGALRVITVPFEVLPMSGVSEINCDQLPVLNGPVAEGSRLCAVMPRQKLTLAVGMTGPWISMGLIRAARAYLLEHNVRYCFFLIADSLARILKRVGMEFIPVGPVSSYRGKRRPYIHDLQLGYREMPLKAPAMHLMFCNRTSYRLASESYPQKIKTNRRPAMQQRVYDNVLFSRGV